MRWMILSLGLAVVSSSVHAQTPVPWARRGVIDRDVTFRLDAAPPDRTLLDSGELGEGYGLRILHRDRPRGEDDTFVTWGVGVAVAPARRFEFGVKAAPVLLAPNVRYGDLETYARFVVFQSRKVDVAGQVVVQVPTDDDFGIAAGMPMVFRLHPRVRLDVGVELELVVDEHDDGSHYVRPNLDVPLALAFSLTDRFFVGARGGIFFYDFDALSAPLGGFLGFTAGRRHTADFTVAFNGYVGDTDAVWEMVFGISGRFWLGS